MPSPTHEQPFDRSSKWLIQHFPRAILQGLAGIDGIQSCRPLPAELVQPRLVPDGLLEVHFDDRDEPKLVLVEVATYPDRRLNE